MRKNIHRIVPAVPTLQIAQTGGVRSLYATRFEVGLLAKIIDISKSINRSKILKGKRAPFEKNYNPQQPNIYFRIKKLSSKSLFIVKSSRVGTELFKLLNQDVEPIEWHFQEHVFNPYLKAFFEVKTELESRYQLSKYPGGIPKNIRSSMSLDRAKLAVRLGYLFVRLIQEKGLGRIENSYDKPVRKNILSLTQHLKRLTNEPHAPLVVQELILSVLNRPSEPSQAILSHTESEKKSLDSIKPFPPRHLEDLTPRTELYGALKRAREEYLKFLRKEGSVKRYLRGYVWKLAYNTHISWSYKLLLFYDSSVWSEQDTVFQAAERLWASMITPLKAMTISDFTLPSQYPHTPQMPVNVWVYKNKAEFVERVVTQTMQSDYLVRVKAPNKDKTLGKGSYRL